MILIPKHRKKEVVDHILQGDCQLTNRKEKSVKRRAPTAYQMPETLSVSETFKIPRNRHCFWDPSTLQVTHELLIREFPIHLDGPTLDFPRDKIKEDRHRLSKSLPDLKIKNFSRV